MRPQGNSLTSNATPLANPEVLTAKCGIAWVGGQPLEAAEHPEVMHHRHVKVGFFCKYQPCPSPSNTRVAGVCPPFVSGVSRMSGLPPALCLSLSPFACSPGSLS